MHGRLAWAEAENLPFADATFDACWSVGGFNYYSDHEAALREMRRVTKPGGPVVVADEVPGLHRAGLGHLLGVPSLDAWWLRKLGLDREFVTMVLEFDVDLKALASRVWPQASGTGSGTGWATVLSIRSTLIEIDPFVQGRLSMSTTSQEHVASSACMSAT